MSISAPKDKADNDRDADSPPTVTKRAKIMHSPETKTECGRVNHQTAAPSVAHLISSHRASALPNSPKSRKSVDLETNKSTKPVQPLSKLPETHKDVPKKTSPVNPPDPQVAKPSTIQQPVQPTLMASSSKKAAYMGLYFTKSQTLKCSRIRDSPEPSLSIVPANP